MRCVILMLGIEMMSMRVCLEHLRVVLVIGMMRMVVMRMVLRLNVEATQMLVSGGGLLRVIAVVAWLVVLVLVVSCQHMEVRLMKWLVVRLVAGGVRVQLVIGRAMGVIWIGGPKVDIGTDQCGGAGLHRVRFAHAPAAVVLIWIHIGRELMELVMSWCHAR
jgi:hypothetical protein